MAQFKTPSVQRELCCWQRPLSVFSELVWERNFCLKLSIQELDSVCHLTSACSSIHSCNSGCYSQQAAKNFPRLRPGPSAVNKIKGSCNSPFPRGGFLTCTAPADRVQLQWQEVDWWRCRWHCPGWTLQPEGCTSFLYQQVSSAASHTPGGGASGAFPAWPPPLQGTQCYYKVETRTPLFGIWG